MARRSGVRKILVVIATAQRRGAELQGTELARGLTQSGFDARVIAVEPGSSSDRLDVPTLGRSRRSVRGLLAVRRAARHAVVVAHGSSALLTVGLATKALRTGWVYRSIGDPAAWVSGRSQVRRTGSLLRRAAAVVVLWPGAGQTMQRLYRVDPRRIVVIPNSRNPERFSPVTEQEREEARTALGLSGRVVAWIGSLSSEKRPLDAVRVAAALSDTTLVVAGEGPLLDEMRRAGDEVAPGRVRLLGSIADPERLLAASDALLLTSATEGMPGVVIESLMRHVPVVATDVGAVRSMLAGAADRAIRDVGDIEGLAESLRSVMEAPEAFWAGIDDDHIAQFADDNVVGAWARLLA